MPVPGAVVTSLLFTSAEDGDIRRPRPPRLICPPLRPAARASSAVHSCAVPFSCAARPPLLAISRCFSGDIDANPRRSFLTPSTAFLLLLADHIRSVLPRGRRGILDGRGRRFVRWRLRRVVPFPVAFVAWLGGLPRIRHRTPVPPRTPVPRRCGARVPGASRATRCVPARQNPIGADFGMKSQILRSDPFHTEYGPDAEAYR